MGVGLSFQATSDRTRGSAFTRARRGLNLISEKFPCLQGCCQTLQQKALKSCVKIPGDI